MKKSLVLLSTVAAFAFAAEYGADGYLRAMYVGDKDAKAFDAGGKFGLNGAAGAFRAKLGFYTVEPIGNPQYSVDKVFTSEKHGYSVFGEAAVGYEANGLSVLAGRQKVVTPLVDMDDGRIIPNLYNAVSVKYKPFTETTLEAYYIAQMSGFWSYIFGGNKMGDFVSMSKAAGYGSVVSDARVYALGATQELGTSKLSLWGYHATDLFNLAYGEYQGALPIGQESQLELYLNGSSQQQTGKLKDNLLSRNKTLYQNYAGVKAGVVVGNVSFYQALTRTNNSGGKLDKNMMNVWAGIPQYTVTNEFVMKSFNTDGSNMYKTFFTYKIAPKLETSLNYLYFNGAKSQKIKDESVTEFILASKGKDYTINGVALLHKNGDNSTQTILRSTLEYRF